MKGPGFRCACIIMLAGINAGCGGSDNSSPQGAAKQAPQASGDPLAQYQWHLRNTGQSAFSAKSGQSGMDLNVESVFLSGVTGKGVNVMVLDTGLEVDHEDLKANIDRSMLHNVDAASAHPADGAFDAETGFHGTGVAGIIGAVANNKKGGRGIAPDVRLGGMIFLGNTTAGADTLLDAFGGAAFSGKTAIFNGSWGLTPTAPVEFDPEGSAMSVALQGLERLRGGKGAVFVQAAGNDYMDILGDASLCADSRAAGVSCANGNLDPMSTMPQTIAVGAINAFGVRSSYSTAGSNLLFSAPGGESGGESSPAIVTTDLEGCDHGLSARDAGPNLPNDFDIVGSTTQRQLNHACNYTSLLNGTSSAAPMVSGVVALMLEVNPRLTWRDVRFILMKTARRIDAQSTASQVSLAGGQTYTPQPVWTRNAAGLWFDNRYGFGLVDASQAVAMARAYTGYLNGPMASTGADLLYDAAGRAGAPVPPGVAGGVDIPLMHGKASVRTIEAVQLTLSLDNATMRDVAIELISPAGTRSVLMNAYSVLPATSADVRNFTLASNAFNEEPANGTWKVRVIDTQSRPGAAQAQVTRAALQLFGR